ncbi:MAG: phenylalanine--tRNA ligase subunit beta [Christensenellales bacterium]
MKISLNWINDYVDLSGVDLKDLINKFTLSTAEVEDMYEVGKDISGVIVAKVVSCQNHPNSNHLHLLKVDTGSEVVDCVCGAKNVREDMLVAFAPVGSHVLQGEMKEAVVAGYKSQGMCCSKQELGLEEKSDGIWEIEDDVKLGTDIKSVYQIEDTIFEVDNKSLTNRPDLWGHYGLAREIAVLLNRPLKNIVVDDLGYYSQMNTIPVEVYAPSCYRYSAIKIANITKKVSPINVQIRLYYCGMRAINLLADLTNYVMLELGQPMHAFDGNCAQKIEVREIINPTKFVTLDKEERVLQPGTVVICNENEPMCVAGVMGGLNSEITDESTSVILESANFESSSIRKTANSLGLRSEASARYEKSLDPEMTTDAIGRFIHILRVIDGDVRVVSGLTDVYNSRYPHRTISTSVGFINHYIGVNLGADYIVNVLSSLGFKVNSDGYNLEIQVPSYRATKDVTIPVDIVEEVARIYGYDNIKPQPVEDSILPVEQSREHLLEYDVKLVLAERFGLNETHSYVWNDVATNKELNIQTNGHIKILNSTIKDNDEIRSELVPTLLKVVNDNKKQLSDFGTFEIGRVVVGKDENNLAIEKKYLAVALFSTQQTEKELYLQVKNIAECLSEQFLNKKVCYKLKEQTKNYLHPINNASLLIDGKNIGYISSLHPETLDAIDKKSAVAVLEIDFSDFANIVPAPITLETLSKYQKTTLDFNFVMDKHIVYAETVENLSKVVTNLKYNINLKDIYVDEQNLAGKKCVTYTVTLFSDDHTLTSAEIDDFQNSFIQNANSFGYELR